MSVVGDDYQPVLYMGYTLKLGKKKGVIKIKQTERAMEIEG